MNFGYGGIEKTKRRDESAFAEIGAELVNKLEEEYRIDLEEKEIFSTEQIEALVREKKEETIREMAEDYLGIARGERQDAQVCTDSTKLLFGWGTSEITESNESVRERLEECGVRTIELSGVLEDYQETIARNVEEMCDSYPELKGYIGSIRAVDLDSHVFACAGPRMDENGFYTELQVNRKLYSHEGIEKKIAKLEMPNWKGETYLAGYGEDAILKHEMGHLLHLRMLAEEQGLRPGSNDRDAYREVQTQYQYNLIATRICSDVFREQGVHPNDRAKVISIYGARDMGECFAEAIAEHETRKNPRAFATEVYNQYQRRMRKNDNHAT